MNSLPSRAPSDAHPARIRTKIYLVRYDRAEVRHVHEAMVSTPLREANEFGNRIFYATTSHGRERESALTRKSPGAVPRLVRRRRKRPWSIASEPGVQAEGNNVASPAPEGRCTQLKCAYRVSVEMNC